MHGSKRRQGKHAELTSSSMVRVPLPIPAPHADLALDDAHAARRRYKKDLDLIKPDLAAYNRQKEVAMGLAAGTLTNFNPTAGSSAVCNSLFRLLTVFLRLLQLVPTDHEQKAMAETFYRDANTLMYGDNKPSEDAIDRVVSKINKEFVTLLSCPCLILTRNVCSIDKKGKFSRKRPNEDEGDITYINEHNRVFNKKVNSTLGLPTTVILSKITLTDCEVLRQVHYRDSCQLRTRNCSINCAFSSCLCTCRSSIYRVIRANIIFSHKLLQSYYINRNLR